MVISEEGSGVGGGEEGMHILAVVLNTGRCCPPVDICQCLQMFFSCHNWESAAGNSWTEARDVSKHPTRPGIPPTANKNSVQNVISREFSGGVAA